MDSPLWQIPVPCPKFSIKAVLPKVTLSNWPALAAVTSTKLVGLCKGEDLANC